MSLFNPTWLSGSVLALIFSFGTGYLTGDIKRAKQDALELAVSIGNANAIARSQEQIITKTHHEITKSTLGEKDAIEKNRQQFMAQYVDDADHAARLRQSSAGVSTSSDSAPGPPSPALRFSSSDAHFLNNFAAQCALVEAERNEVIQKYEALP